MDYYSRITKLADRIAALAEKHPSVLELESSWDLFKYDDFDYKDLQPSLAQVGVALALVKAGAKESKVINTDTF